MYKKEWGEFISDGVINQCIASWHQKQPDRSQDCASPSSLLECPRVIWLKKHDVEPLNKLGWGKKQRFMLGRQLENMIADQLKDEDILLYHWRDNFDGESDKFSHGEGLDKIEGTPDLLLQLDKVAISDSKTSRSDSFKYVPIDDDEIWADPYWFKHKLQLTAYFMLCHWNKEWFNLPLIGNDLKTVIKEKHLPLPEVCHLFSYALDDGIVRREITWKPTKVDMESVGRLTRRWNSGYASKTVPKCTCVEDDSVKFCPFGTYPTDENGKQVGKVCTECCFVDEELINELTKDET